MRRPFDPDKPVDVSQPPCKICQDAAAARWDEVCANCYWSFIDHPPYLDELGSDGLEEHKAKYEQEAIRYTAQYNQRRGVRWQS